MFVTGDGRKSLINRLQYRFNNIVMMIVFCVDVVDYIARFGLSCLMMCDGIA